MFFDHGVGQIVGSIRPVLLPVIINGPVDKRVEIVRLGQISYDGFCPCVGSLRDLVFRFFKDTITLLL